MSNETIKNADTGPLAQGISIIKNCQKIAPHHPGVYRMLDEAGNVLYVGKAKSIKKRVMSYTQINRLTHRLQKMVSRTAEMIFVTTHTEAEALLLEASLIKRFKPTYNVLLKDDKSFPYILLRTDHKWVQITKHRGARKKGGKYYGPFANTSAVTRTLNTLQKVFQLRSCTDATLESRTRACLLHQIKRCAAPCVDKINEADYGQLVKDTEDFLEGRTTHIQKRFADKMQAASDATDYEVAALYRDRLTALSQIQSHQSLANAMVENADIIAAADTGGQVCIQVFFFRAGQNWGHRAYFPRHASDASIEDVLTAFITQFYDNKPIPKEVLLSHDIMEHTLLREALSERAERKISVTVPKRGRKKEAMQQAILNAEQAGKRRMAETASQQKLQEGVAKLFAMDAPPERIEVYDNSHIQGTNAIGAMIVAGPEGFMKNSYRKYNIKDERNSPGDDFGMMREVMERRFKRLQKETSEGDGNGGGEWPDLLLIDGGKGQLSSVHEVLDDLGVTDLKVVAISKGPDRNAGREQFHIRGQQSFTLPVNDPVLYYLQRLRDEAHRFAIGTHRTRRKNDLIKSPLDGLKGVGAKRKKALLHYFGSGKAVQDAGVKEMMMVDGISKALAQSIYDHFHEET